MTVNVSLGAMVDRVFVQVANALSQRIEGYVMPFLPEVVERYGPLETIKRVRTLNVIMDRLERQLGPVPAHVVVAYASMWNGCRFCGVGHMRSANLEYFAQTGRLFPVSEQQLYRSMWARDDEILAGVRRALDTDEHRRTLALVERQYQLKWAKVTDSRPDDELLIATTALYDWATHCSIVSQDIDAIPALSKIGKDHAVAESYDTARRASRSASGGSH